MPELPRLSGPPPLTASLPSASSRFLRAVCHCLHVPFRRVPSAVTGNADAAMLIRSSIVAAERDFSNVSEESPHGRGRRQELISGIEWASRDTTWACRCSLHHGHGE